MKKSEIFKKQYELLVTFIINEIELYSKDLYEGECIELIDEINYDQSVDSKIKYVLEDQICVLTEKIDIQLNLIDLSFSNLCNILFSLESSRYKIIKNKHFYTIENE